MKLNKLKKKVLTNEANSVSSDSETENDNEDNEDNKAAQTIYSKMD
eukprot:CAMPEP_0116880126 /NCGR_PEP_ID=MMETSP0463-20121206/12007_1 /TAXON_ID=181622 /ORGANISM="Strombidinopsis sp, Strain SopsisLIS2011" /LENGTH=45 /DNA_ID= /DNA_START= /DNA_END= /DNA_ORIENTATION=